MQVDIRPMDIGDPDQVDAALQVLNDAIAEDVPDFPLTSRAQYEGQLRYPRPGHLNDRWVGFIDGVPAGVVSVGRPTLDNQHAANVEVTVHPRHRRQGLGRALHGLVVEFARANDRRILQGGYVVALPEGPPRSSGHRAFAETVGAKSALTEVRRRLDLETVDRTGWDALLADARSRAAGYSVVAWTDSAPDEVAAGLAELNSRFLAEAPIGELDLQPQNVDVKRVRDGEETSRNRGSRNYHVAARHNTTGAVAAWTHIGFETDRVEHAWQEITIVDRAHRGRRLGMLVKMENLLRTLAAEPRLRHIDTWNAAENAHMIAINEAMGFRAVDAWVNWQQEA